MSFFILSIFEVSIRIFEKEPLCERDNKLQL